MAVVEGRRTTAGMSKLYPRLDLGHPEQFHAVVQNISNVYYATPHQIREAARPWYEHVNEGVAKGVRRTSMSPRAGAGIVAAVSPAMDFESRNIHALTEIKRFTMKDWDVIHASNDEAERKRAENRPVRAANLAEKKAADKEGRAPVYQPLPHATAGRSPEASALLKGLALSHTSDRFLMEGHRIMQGEDFADVMPRTSSPKRNAFGEAIDDPLGERRKAAGQVIHVPIDYRAHDIGANRMIPTEYTGRGIDEADHPSGKETRYEHFEKGYRAGAEAVGEDPELAHQMQAITWVGGKHIETNWLTQKGERAKRGAARVGQPYA